MATSRYSVLVEFWAFTTIDIEAPEQASREEILDILDEHLAEHGDPPLILNLDRKRAEIRKIGSDMAKRPGYPCEGES